jgi:RND family efflux transporter MFP subunit
MLNNSGSIAFKLGAVLAVGAALAIAVLYFLRPAARVMAVTTGVAVNAVPGSVTVAAVRQAPITCEIAGRILKSEIEIGKRFKAGDFMAQIDPGDLDLQIQKTEIERSALEAAIKIGSRLQTQLANAEDELKIKQRFFEMKTLPQVELTKQERFVDDLKQQIAREKIDNQRQLDTLVNSLETMRRQRDKMTVTAPFDGVVDRVLAHERDQVGGNSSIASFISLGRYVEGRISEENFAGVKVGDKAVVRFLSYGLQNFEATVSEKLPSAEPETQRYLVRLDVKIPPEQLLPGLTGEVSIVLGERKDATLVPRLALRGNQLFVVRDGRVEARSVKLGYTSLTDVEVLQGVKPGEIVIVDELDRFHDGQRVRPEVVKP